MDMMYMILGICLGGTIVTFLLSCHVQREVSQISELMQKTVDLQERLMKASASLSQRQSEQWLETERRFRKIETQRKEF